MIDEVVGLVWKVGVDVNVAVEKVVQCDIQKLGGECARYPSSYVVCYLLKKYGLSRVLDVTFGEGRFYKLCRSFIELLVAADPVRRNWVVSPDEFYQYNVFYLLSKLRSGDVRIVNALDVVVIDPPKWSEGASYRKREMYDFLIGSPKLIIEYGAKVASLLGVRNLLVHYRNLVEISGYIPKHVVEFKWFARYLNTKNKNTSLYIIYEKGG